MVQNECSFERWIIFKLEKRRLFFHTEEGLYTRNVCVNRQFWHFAIIVSLIINLISQRQTMSSNCTVHFSTETSNIVLCWDIHRFLFKWVFIPRGSKRVLTFIAAAATNKARYVGLHYMKGPGTNINLPESFGKLSLLGQPYWTAELEEPWFLGYVWQVESVRCRVDDKSDKFHLDATFYFWWSPVR